MIGDNLAQYTYEYLMNLALSYVPDDRDKRQGSVIFDALAPFCQLLAAGALQLRDFYSQTYAVTATGVDLDNRVAEQGVTRYSATYAVRKIVATNSQGNPMSLPIGSRFSTVSDTNPVNYTVTAAYKENGVVIPGTYEATCEELGVVGNEYSGKLINLTFVQGLASAQLTTTLVPAQDEETDDELRQRYFEALNQKAFGGNIADYKAKVMEIPGVADVQVYPTWNGGGTVKLSIVDATYGPCTSEFVQSVQTLIDPEVSHGAGLGIAPIGHQVTVVTPTEVVIDVSARLSVAAGYSRTQVEADARQALADYIQSLKQSWADADQNNVYTCNVLVSRVTAAIISVPGVADITNVTLNGSGDSISLTQTGAVQQLPKLGEVILNV